MKSCHVSLNLKNVLYTIKTIIVDKPNEERYFAQMAPLTVIYQHNFSSMFWWLKQNFLMKIKCYQTLVYQLDL